MGLIMVPILIWKIAGFGAAGVVKGGAAAAVQSLVYGATTSGLFSFLQATAAAAFVAAV